MLKNTQFLKSEMWIFWSYNLKLIDLFEVISGNGLDLNKMILMEEWKDNYINFIGRTSKNQGVVARVKLIPEIIPFSSGLITVALGGSMLSSFVQQKSFYTAEHMKVLKPKKDMSLQEKLYYCICIKKNDFKYTTFGREADRTIKNLEIPDNVPSWVNDKKTIQTFQDTVISAL